MPPQFHKADSTAQAKGDSAHATPAPRKRSSAAAAAAAISQQKRKEREEDMMEDQQHQATKQQKTSSNTDSPTNSSITLPPPPGRSRKIIQMKPKAMPQPAPAPTHPTETDAATAPTKAKNAGGRSAKKTQHQQSTQQPTTPAKATAATRKTARKTAHSLIERRRRFKMNEEFGVLKSMIPACRGVEMHKLAILQASIEYLNYLEDCIEKLKTTGGSSEANVEDLSRAMPQRRESSGEERMEDGEDEEDEEDAEEEDEEPEETVQGDVLMGGECDRRDESEDNRREWGSGEIRTPPRDARAGITFIHHQHQYHPPHHHHKPSPPARGSRQNYHQSHHPHHPHHHAPERAFVTTHNIPPQPLPPPVLSTSTSPTTATYTPPYVPHPTAPAMFPPLNNSHKHNHNNNHYQKSSYSSASSSASSRDLHEESDREATHALLLLAGDVEGKGRRESSGSFGSGGYRSLEVSPVEAPRGGSGGRTMSVRDLLSS